MLTYNTHFHKTSTYTPFELLFGHKARIPNSLNSKPEFKYTYDDYYNNLKLKMNRSFEIARENILKSKQQSKLHYDKKIKIHKFNKGDYVYVQNNSIKQDMNKKLLPNYKGQFKIIEVYDNPTVKILLNNNKTAVYHHNLLKPFFSDNQNDTIDRA